MKKKVFLVFVLALLVLSNAFSFTYSPDFDPEGLLFDFSVNYGKIFNTEYDLINIEFLFSPYPSRPLTLNLGILASLSPNISIFDLYTYLGLTYYPFGRILSFSCNIGIGCSIYALVNHFPYIVNAKVNIDIPIYKDNYLTLGIGAQHRNALLLLGYLKSESYYGVYNSYYFVLGYRIIIK